MSKAQNHLSWGTKSLFCGKHPVRQSTSPLQMMPTTNLIKGHLLTKVRMRGNFRDAIFFCFLSVFPLWNSSIFKESTEKSSEKPLKTIDRCGNGCREILSLESASQLARLVHKYSLPLSICYNRFFFFLEWSNLPEKNKWEKIEPKIFWPKVHLAIASELCEFIWAHFKRVLFFKLPCLIKSHD